VRSPEASPRVLAIVLCYPRLDLTIDCLTSLRALEYKSCDVLVVDNGSEDGTASSVRERFPEMAVRETGANLGFAAGNTVGLRYVLEQGYDYALLPNNDAVVVPDCLEHLVAAAESDPTIGTVGPTIYYFDQPDLIWSAGGIIDWQRGTDRMRGNKTEDRGQYQLADVDFVSGCACSVSARY
jgi:GT2 family glycosyltransferase